MGVHSSVLGSPSDIRIRSTVAKVSILFILKIYPAARQSLEQPEEDWR